MFIIWQEEVNELLSSQDEVDSHDILKDPLTQVFGVDTRGHVRGVGNVISGTQIVGSSTALEKLATKEKKVLEESTSIKNLEDQVNYVTSVHKKLFEELGAIKQMIEVKIYWNYWIFLKEFHNIRFFLHVLKE